VTSIADLSPLSVDFLYFASSERIASTAAPTARVTLSRV
jgi:hypothetical protein